MASDKLQITATIKFRGVTIEGMTIQELRDLRDVLTEMLGERVIERREYVSPYPWVVPWITTTGTWKVDSDASNTLRLNGSTMGDSGTHFTLTCN